MKQGKIIELKSAVSPEVKVFVKEQPQKGEAAPEIRVAAYCRVSTDMESQELSLEVQMDAFNRTISEHPGWKLAGIYKDKGLTGTSAKKRPGFLQMIKDAEDGKIDYILTKSISRFARNTVDLLHYTRHLKEIGVGVFFDEQNLDTANELTEMLLTIHAAFAQEESHSISENRKSGLRKRYAMGIPQWFAIYGYRKNKDDEWIIEEKEAEMVRRIYADYISGMTLPEIAKAYAKEGIVTARGKKFIPTQLSLIIKNEKYLGDVALQKYYNPDFLTHKCVKNKEAILPRYYKQDHHPAIIDRESFTLARTIAIMKDNHRGAQQYPYYGFLRCPLCKAPMVSSSLEWHHHHGYGWTCGGYESKEAERNKRTKCPEYFVIQKYIDRAFWEATAGLPEKEKKGTRLESRTGGRVEYIYLYEMVKSITFGNKNGTADFYELIIEWKSGRITKTRIEYKNPSELPVINPVFKDGRYLADGKEVCRRGGTSYNVYKGVCVNREFCRRLLIFNEPKPELIEGMRNLGVIDVPSVIAPSSIKEVPSDG